MSYYNKKIEKRLVNSLKTAKIIFFALWVTSPLRPCSGLVKKGKKSAFFDIIEILNYQKMAI